MISFLWAFLVDTLFGPFLKVYIYIFETLKFYFISFYFIWTHLKQIFVHFCPFWYQCYYQHQSRDSVSPVCRIMSSVGGDAVKREACII